MFYDAMTLASVCDELHEQLLGGRVQRVLSLSELALGCEIYAKGERRWLLASAHPQNARVHLVPEKLARGSEDATPLLLLLRKHVRGSRLVAIEQPELERVLILSFAKRAEESETIQRTKLIIEVMGRHSNIILAAERAGDGVIIDRAPPAVMVLESARHVTAQLSRFRVVLPRHPYVPPPRQDKTAPHLLDAAALEGIASDQRPETALWQALVGAIAGMSPLLAHEAVFRACGDAQAGSGVAAEEEGARRLLAELQGLYGAARDHRWSPSIARAGGKVVAFAPYLLSHQGEVERRTSISEAIADYYAELEEVSPVGIHKERLRARLTAVRDRHGRRRASLERAVRQSQELEQLRRSGEAILASIGSIAPKQGALEFDGRSIKLDPALGPLENAQAYFREYKKAKSALAQVPELVSAEDATIAYLDEVAAQVELAETVEEVRRVAADLEAAGLVEAGHNAPAKPKPKPKPKAKTKGRDVKAAGGKRRDLPSPYRVLPGGYEIYVGRSARENEAVTFAVAGPEDLWLHARGVPGAHVVVKSAGRPAPDAVVAQAANLAAIFSRARDARHVAVDCTERKHVRRVRAGLPGLVTYSEERTIDVMPGPAS